MAARLACPRIPAGYVVVVADRPTIGFLLRLATRARMTRSLIGRHYSAASYSLLRRDPDGACERRARGYCM